MRRAGAGQPDFLNDLADLAPPGLPLTRSALRRGIPRGAATPRDHSVRAASQGKPGCVARYAVGEIRYAPGLPWRLCALRSASDRAVRGGGVTRFFRRGGPRRRAAGEGSAHPIQNSATADRSRRKIFQVIRSGFGICALAHRCTWMGARRSAPRRHPDGQVTGGVIRVTRVTRFSRG